MPENSAVSQRKPIGKIHRSLPDILDQKSIEWILARAEARLEFYEYLYKAYPEAFHAGRINEPDPGLLKKFTEFLTGESSITAKSNTLTINVCDPPSNTTS